MTPEPENSDWLDEVQSGRVSRQRAVQLRAEVRKHPKEAARLEEELALNAVLARLPDVPAPSNLAARVLEEIGREEAQFLRPSRRWGAWWRGWGLLRPMAVTATLALALSGWWQFRLHERRTLAESVSEVSLAAAVPGVDALEDLQAIQLLRTSAQPGDLELIAALATP